MVPPNSRSVSVKVYERPLTRLAMIGALVAALGLAACGRKGPLDPPPGAASAAPTQESAPATPAMIQPIGGGTPGRSHDGAGITREGAAVAPKGEKKRIPIDVLLD